MARMVSNRKRKSSVFDPNNMSLHLLGHNRLDDLPEYIKIFIPYKSLEYYRDYFDYVRRVHHRHRYDGQLSDPKGHRRLCQFYRGLAILHYLKALHLLYLYLFRHTLSETEKIIEGDLGHFYKINPICQVLIIMPMFCTLEFFRLLYLNPFEMGNAVLDDILFSYRNPEQHFIWPYKFYRYSARNVIKWTAWLLANSFQFFILIIHLTAMVFLLKMLKHVIRHRSQFECDWINPNVSLTLVIILVLVIVEIGYFLAICFAHMSILMVNIGCISILFILIRLWQTNQMLKILLRVTNGRLIQDCIWKFLRFERETIVYVLRGNNYYGQAFFWFLLANFPINCYLIAEFLLGEGETDSKIFLVFGVIQQWICIFGIHLALASLNNRISGSNKPIIKLFHQKRRCFRSLRLLLATSIYIETMHTDKRYGVTYGRFGLVSMKSFVMCIGLYLEWILYVYKFVNQFN